MSLMRKKLVYKNKELNNIVLENTTSHANESDNNMPDEQIFRVKKPQNRNELLSKFISVNTNKEESVNSSISSCKSKESKSNKKILIQNDSFSYDISKSSKGSKTYSNKEKDNIISSNRNTYIKKVTFEENQNDKIQDYCQNENLSFTENSEEKSLNKVISKPTLIYDILRRKSLVVKESKSNLNLISNSLNTSKDSISENDKNLKNEDKLKKVKYSNSSLNLNYRNPTNKISEEQINYNKSDADSIVKLKKESSFKLPLFDQKICKVEELDDEYVENTGRTDAKIIDKEIVQSNKKNYNLRKKNFDTSKKSQISEAKSNISKNSCHNKSILSSRYNNSNSSPKSSCKSKKLKKALASNNKKSINDKNLIVISPITIIKIDKEQIDMESIQNSVRSNNSKKILISLNSIKSQSSKKSEELTKLTLDKYIPSVIELNNNTIEEIESNTRKKRISVKKQGQVICIASPQFKIKLQKKSIIDQKLSQNRKSIISLNDMNTIQQCKEMIKIFLGSPFSVMRSKNIMVSEELKQPKLVFD